MARSPKWLFLSLMTGLAACGDGARYQDETYATSVVAVPIARRESPTAPSAESRSATDVLGKSIRQLLDGDWEAHYFDAWIDLNGDGSSEAVVLVAGPMVCGTGGCPLFVLAGNDSAGYQPVSSMSVVQAPVRVSTRSTNGWRNLVVGIGGGGMPADNAELEFDGAGYPSNPTVAPAKPIADLDRLEVLLAEFGSYRDGKLVPLPPVAGAVFGEPVYAENAENLRYRVLRALLDRYAQQKGIEVSQAEMETYIQRQCDATVRDRTKRESRRAELAAELTSGDLSEADRAVRERELQEVTEAISALDEMFDPASDSSDDRAIREELAGSFIWQWKVNQALFREYGGRIVYQQGGPEPLDAYRNFLEAAKQRGDFSIADPALENEFWRYYREDSMHSFFDSGSEEEARAFATPWWLAEP